MSIDWVKYVTPMMAVHIDRSRTPKFWGNLKKLFTFLIVNDKYECELVDFLAHFNFLYSGLTSLEYQFDIN
jgi:hypothetical protein